MRLALVSFSRSCPAMACEGCCFLAVRHAASHSMDGGPVGSIVNSSTASATSGSLGRDSARLLHLELAGAQVDHADEGPSRVVQHAVAVAGEVLEGQAVALQQVQHPRREARVGAHVLAGRPRRGAEQLLVLVAVQPEAVLVLVVRVVDLRVYQVQSRRVHRDVCPGLAQLEVVVQAQLAHPGARRPVRVLSRGVLQPPVVVVVVRAPVPRRIPHEVRRDGGALDDGGGVGPPRLLHVHAGVDALRPDRQKGIRILISVCFGNFLNY